MIQNSLRNSAQGLSGPDGFEAAAMGQSQEIDFLKEELREARETLDAIRSGAADALVRAHGLDLREHLVCDAAGHRGHPPGVALTVPSAHQPRQTVLRRTSSASKP